MSPLSSWGPLKASFICLITVGWRGRGRARPGQPQGHHALRRPRLQHSSPEVKEARKNLILPLRENTRKISVFIGQTTKRGGGVKPLEPLRKEQQKGKHR